MRFSTLAVSLLASGAAAKKSCTQKVHTEYVTFTVTAGGPQTPSSSSASPTSSSVSLVSSSSKESIVSVLPTTFEPSSSVESTTSLSVESTSTTAAVIITTSAVASSTSEAPSSSAPVSTSAPSTDLTTDEQAALDAHNTARAAVGSPDLIWDASLASDAQAWADHLASLGKLEHSSGSGQGENLYMQSGSNDPFLNAVNAFNSEKSDYTGGVIDSTNYSHYTQVVWKKTTHLGMAKATGNGGTWVVARYSPPGNYLGELPY
ncbi:unnamed protein product [Clonostachys rosea]|uniref:SCP domain-containing protein n=1 Tax=Bionectria ochroleuca TaxID=29856 RepID=A0ABY6UGW1_BIOOC|nr:unnamed protein product [Clonostachys rosea]